MCTLSFVPGHERLKGGALASAVGTAPAVGTAHAQTGHQWLAQ